MGVGKRYDSTGLGGRVDSERLVVGSEEKSGGRESERADPFPALEEFSSRGKSKQARMVFGKHGRE